MRRNVSLVVGQRLGKAKWLRNTVESRRNFVTKLESSPRTKRFAIEIPHEVRRQLSHNATAAYVDRPLGSEEPTIYALSTAPGRAGIAIIRISGPAVLDVQSITCPVFKPANGAKIYRGLCKRTKLPEDRRAVVRSLFDPQLHRRADSLLDKDALLIHFQAPSTVTGEDVLELHVHGGPATVKAVLSAIPRCTSAGPIRYAEAGEFTRRAFQNYRLSLSQVEALSTALSADTEMQRRAAMNGTSGDLDRKYESWRQQLLQARGELEAIIDFSEDQDFDVSDSKLLTNIEHVIRPMLYSIQQHEDGGRRAELLRKGIRISLLGPPNAGKSSLLNRIVGREASIVSTEPGTTRDIVEVSVDIEGYLCTFADTAGLRSQPAARHDRTPESILASTPPNLIGAIEQEGISRAKQKAADSDFVIGFASVETRPEEDEPYIKYNAEVLRIASQAPKSMIVVNKTDVVSDEHLAKLLDQFRASLQAEGLEYTPESIVPISCKPRSPDTLETPNEDSGNIRRLTITLADKFRDMTYVDERHHLGVTERQRQLLRACREDCQEYLKETQKTEDSGNGFDVVVAAEHLRAAANCLSRITGRGQGGDVEEVLGVVFEK